MGVPFEVSFHTSSKSSLLIAIQPSVQSVSIGIQSPMGDKPQLSGVPCIIIIPPGDEPIFLALALSFLFG